MLSSCQSLHCAFRNKFRLLLFCLILTGVVSCSKKATPAPVGGSDIPPSKVNLKRNVELCKVEQKVLISAVEGATGVLEAEAISEIPAGVAGIVDEVLFREGDEVDPKQRKPLIKIDQRRYQAELEMAESNEKEAVANLNTARDVYRRSLEGGTAVSAELRKQALEGVAGAEAKLNSLRAMIKIARYNYDCSQVIPPFKGQINKRMVAPGSYVDKDTKIATIADLSKIRLVGYVPETASPLVRRRMMTRPKIHAARTLAVALSGTPVMGSLGNISNQVLIAIGEVPSGFDPEFTLQAFPNRVFRAGIFSMSKVADPTTHMFECKAEIDPRTLGLEELAPGFSARIRYPLETSNDAMIIPEESVRATERGFIVFVPVKRTNKDGVSEWIGKPRRVEIGSRSPGSVEIRSGLAPNEWIVKRGAEALEDGTPLRFSPEQQKMLEQQ
jgi:membrane fusion protein, multidrug efflux system